MQSYRKDHISLREVEPMSVVQHGLPRLKCKILFIAGLLIVFVTTIIVSILVSSRSTNKSSSSSAVRVLTTKSSSSMTSSLSLTALSIESTMTMADEIETFPTKAFDNATPMQWSREGSTTTTTTMIPPNLLINPGAENKLDGWTQMTKASAIIDSEGKFHKNYHPHSGTYCFAGGKGGDTHSKLHQRIDLVGGVQGFTEEQLDSGKLKVHVSFYYQTWRDIVFDDDYSKVDVSIRNNSLEVLGGIHTGELHCTPNPGWCHYNDSISLPVGARVIYYVMLFYERKNDYVGLPIDVYIDDNSLTIL